MANHIHGNNYERFKIAATANRDAMIRGNYRDAEKQLRNIAKITNRIKNNHGQLLEFYEILLSDKDYKISSVAAIICLTLEILTEQAKKILQKTANRKDIGALSSDAKEVLEDWKKDSLKTQNHCDKATKLPSLPKDNDGEKSKNLPPCKTGKKKCIYEYGMSDRDIEGMPFSKNRFDKRICPKFGHICPKFMEEFDLMPEDLNIRATIHCGTLAKEMIEKGEWDLGKMDKAQANQIKSLLDRLDDMLKKYPPEEYPKYY